ncbi:MAG: hypothetical protein ACFCUR_01765 [Rhodomicrobiaceae bacterium]
MRFEITDGAREQSGRTAASTSLTASRRQRQRARAFLKPALWGIACCIAFPFGKASANAIHGNPAPVLSGAAAGSVVITAERAYPRLAQAGQNAFSVESAGNLEDGAIDLKFRLTEGTEHYRFLMIRGLPDGFRMSAGFPTREAWFVAMADIDQLQLLPSEGYAGDLNLQFMLFRRDDPAPEKKIVALRIDPQKLQTAAVPDITPEQATGALRTEPARQPAFTPARPARQLSEEAENAEMERARQFLANADIAAARLLYETLAMKGSARAAFAMGQTYDRRFLKNIQLQGLRPDPAEARKWYGLAIELGSADAESWLAALN